MRTIPILPPAAAAAAAALLASACGPQAVGPEQGGRVQVVAAENMWGSIVAQVGGAHAHVSTIIASPDVDPHAYEPTPQDAREVATAGYVVVNGAGYDTWADRLVAANPLDGRITLDVAELAGRKPGDNPHMWYSPPIVGKVVQRIAADLGRLDPAHAVYFRQRAESFADDALKAYDDARSAIRTRFRGTPVGATESIFVDMAEDLGLDLVTPPGYMRAVAEGEDPSSQDKRAVDAEVRDRSIKVLVFNSQNSTPDVQSLVDRARGAGIPVVAVTETLDPAGATFQDWQTRQLTALLGALEAGQR